ncbi:hypothetical protein SNOG_13126 [Parastagonospora nodorum SN15]|uniref:Uncharacterized protein n=1 Tax=Phaeosphaeria nodorum (strain SN15 / ATCC MYA-4574 / FGSC 10173) TaxID=321614 RepID=Q0U538_PHANO|nr:hypothetical protein SNOG_13126 [Parastagonospora nodorum SN15]EAT79453.1 hypothetical protein SNOG_13126 [Parastagonospora nodorum SN15]
MKTLTFLLGLFALAMSTAITQASDATFPCSAADFLRLPPRDRSQPPPPPLPNCGACKDILRKCNDGRLPDEDLLNSLEWEVLRTMLVALLSIQHSGLVKEMMRWKGWSRRQLNEDL